MTSSFSATSAKLTKSGRTSRRTGFFNEFIFSAEANKPITFKMCQRRCADNTSSDIWPVQTLLQLTAVEGVNKVGTTDFIDIPEKTDFWFDAKVASGSASGSVVFDMFLRDN